MEDDGVSEGTAEGGIVRPDAQHCYYGYVGPEPIASNARDFQDQSQTMSPSLNRPFLYPVCSGVGESRTPQAPARQPDAPLIRDRTFQHRVGPRPYPLTNPARVDSLFFLSSTPIGTSASSSPHETNYGPTTVPFFLLYFIYKQIMYFNKILFSLFRF